MLSSYMVWWEEECVIQLYDMVGGSVLYQPTGLREAPLGGSGGGGRGVGGGHMMDEVVTCECPVYELTTVES